MKMLIKRIALCILFQCGCLQAQTWQAMEQVNVLTDAKSTLFTLSGKFTQGPTLGALISPVLRASCSSHSRSNSYTLLVGTTLASADAVYRLDDRKAQPGVGWNISTDFSGVFIPTITFNDFLYGHLLKHKIDPTKPIHKLIIVMSQFAGSSIIMQFDMPDPTDVAKACGLIK